MTSGGPSGGARSPAVGAIIALQCEWQKEARTAVGLGMHMALS